jgi:hypothetical protein
MQFYFRDRLITLPVIASEAKQSHYAFQRLLRHFVPGNDIKHSLFYDFAIAGCANEGCRRRPSSKAVTE